jgi:hypothetical protein
LSDYFGVQVRGGCSCAGTYGHYLLNVDREYSRKITSKIDSGDLSEKPGWVRLSLHPVMTNEELHVILDAIEQVAIHPSKWSKHYRYDVHTNEYYPLNKENHVAGQVSKWFDMEGLE